MTVQIVVVYSIRTLINLQQFTNNSVITTQQNILTGSLDVRNYLPDMRITDFFTGIMRQFNMTCVGLAERQFQVLPLENWYNNGATIDVTKYTDAETAEISRVPLFRNINFRYQKSESFANRNYFAIRQVCFYAIVFKIVPGTELFWCSIFFNMRCTKAVKRRRICFDIC
jgi:hypothetical protein